MRYSALLLLTALAPAACLAGPSENKADVSLGKSLHDKTCTGCHARMYGGDGSGMYTRSGRMVKNQAELLQRVAVCSAMARSGWVPEEEAAVAAWLNQQYYHFEQ